MYERARALEVLQNRHPDVRRSRRNATARIFMRTIRTKQQSLQWTPLSVWAVACPSPNADSRKPGRKFTERNYSTNEISAIGPAAHQDRTTQ
jgi:hypothetical protein